ncbi:MAG: hypothetical protein ACRC92_10990 [Peptostreptococcaceae bacterium]
MIKVNRTNVSGLLDTIYGMRHPMNSHHLMDSKIENHEIIIGENDLGLMQRLFKAGTDHRKFMRQIIIHVDITAPLYWWKEFDTYKVGTTANSTSTMHKIMSKAFTVDDFANDMDTRAEDNLELRDLIEEMYDSHIYKTVVKCNNLRDKYLDANSPFYKNKNIWRLLIQELPSSYMQTRMVSMSYENFVNMYNSRKNHKLQEWPELLDQMLPSLTGLKEIAAL